MNGKIHVTILADKSGSKLTRQKMTLVQLRDLIQTTRASKKEKLKWLKLARFGDKRSDNGSLRTNENVEAISGIEVDYDAGEISFGDAVKTIEKAGISAIVYTTASHTPEHPKWRALCPTSGEYEPQDREALVARLNGLFGGALEDTSFTLSQGYLFGAVNGNRHHKAVLVKGKAIDTRSDLDGKARFRKSAVNGNGHGHNVTDFSDLINRIREGVNIHDSTRDLAAKMAARGLPDTMIIDTLKTEMERSKAPRDKRFKDRQRAIPKLVASALAKFFSEKEVTEDETPISATAFAWVDPAKIPPRSWVYRPHYIRHFISGTISTGGVGKSSLVIAEALAMVTGKPLLGTSPEKSLRVWYFNGEDPMEELQRKFAATAQHFELKRGDIGDRLFVDSGRVMPIVLAEDGRNGVKIATPTIDGVIRTLVENEIDVLIVDPFVSTHRVGENDNGAIERVTKSFAHIADAANCSVQIVHHSRKTNGNEMTVDDGRGASAMLAAVRSARVLNTMSKVEAENFNISDGERRRYFRVDIGKANLTAPSDVADWYAIRSVKLENGDEVGVVSQFDLPEAAARDIGAVQIRQIQAAVKDGGPWRDNRKSKLELWAGEAFAAALNLDLKRKDDLAWVTKGLKEMIGVGYLVRVERNDKHRTPRIYIEAGIDPKHNAKLEF